MASVSRYLRPADLSRFADLQLTARQIVEGATAGRHRSPHKGLSVDFREHRPYVPGDELRHLDWKVWGKTDRLYIRQYEEETNLRLTLLVDASGSMAYAGTTADGFSRFDYAIRLAAALAYLAVQQQDAAGLITFDRRLRDRIPPRSRPSHLRTLISRLEATDVGGETDLDAVLRQLVPKVPRRGLVAFISDGFADPDRLLHALAQLRRRKHDVIFFQLWDRDELEFPFNRWTRFDCLEDPARRETADPAHLKQAYLDNLQRFRDTLRTGCRHHRVDLVEMTTDQPFADALGRYLAFRRSRPR